MTTLDTAVLVYRARRGDQAAFEALVVAHERRVYTLAYRMLRNREDAQEVTQDTFLKAVTALRDLRADDSFTSWLMRIATNKSLTAVSRRRSVATQPLSDEAEDGDPLPHPDMIAPWKDRPEQLSLRLETRRFLEHALGEMDEKYRTVFLLRDVEGFSNDEITRILGIGLSAAKMRLARARLMLRERFTSRFGDGSARMQPSHVH